MSANTGTTTLSSDEALRFAELSVLERLDMIEAKLQEVDPLLGQHMTYIHKTLLQHEELVHILPDAKIHTLMEGMQKYTKTALVEAAIKAPRGKKAKVDEDDF